MSLFNTLCCPYLATTISISNDSLTFPSQYLFFIERVLGFNQSKWPWRSFVCSIACWCSIDLLIIYLFVSPLYNGPHEHFNSYTPGSYLVLTYLCFWNATLNPNFLFYFFDFWSDFWYSREGNCLLLFVLLLLLLLLLLRVFFSKLLIIFCNISLSCPSS